MKKILYSLIVCCLLSQYAYADCNVNNPPTAGISDCVDQGGFFGQAFTACETGEWTTLTFNITNISGTGTATVYSAEGEISDNTLPSAQVAGTFTTGTVQTFTINRPVTSGSRYIWWVELETTLPLPSGFSQVCYEVNNAAFGADDDYVHSVRVGVAEPINSGGLGAASAGGGVGMGGSVAFAAAIVADDREPIPTLSQWGLLIMALLVLNLGLIFIRKKESVML